MGIFKRRRDVATAAAARAVVEPLEKRTMLSVTATTISSSEIDLTWSAAGAGATGLEVDRTSDGTNYTSIATLPATATSYADTGLIEAYPYEYRVDTTYSSGNPIQDYAFAVTAPNAPSGLSATNKDGVVKLSWTDNSQGSEAFDVYRSDNGTSFTQIDTVDGINDSWNDSTAPYGVTSYYRVISDDAFAQSTPSNTVSIVPVAPTSHQWSFRFPSGITTPVIP